MLGFEHLLVCMFSGFGVFFFNNLLLEAQSPELLSEEETNHGDRSAVAEKHGPFVSDYRHGSGSRWVLSYGIRNYPGKGGIRK